ncbi:DUF1254 domain-containing protein [Ramlibacter solisilvae]
METTTPPKRLLVPALLLAAFAPAHAATSPQPSDAGTAASQSAPAAVTDQEISEAYVYLLGRLLVLRQQRLDFEREGLSWNTLVHREAGGVKWSNPNLDVVYSEAWVAVDEQSCVLLEIPKITGRYYGWQMLNGWGETVLNIHDRNFPQQPHGRYALCLKGANVQVPAGALRIDLPSRTSRVLARIELGKDAAEAVRLQHQFKLTPLGQPKIEPPPQVPLFTFAQLPGAEAFEQASAILASESDINPGMDAVRAYVRAAEAIVKSGPEGRARVEKAIRELGVPALGKYRATLGKTQGGWSQPTLGNYGSSYPARTLTNIAGIWANNAREYVAYAARGLDGGAVYTQTFPKEALPNGKAKYYWSVTAVDAKQFHVIPNPLKRHILSSNLSPLKFNADGSLTLVYAPKKPDNHPESNWLPTPEEGKYNLTYRFYGATDDLMEGKYFPPQLVKAP